MRKSKCRKAQEYKTHRMQPRVIDRQNTILDVDMLEGLIDEVNHKTIEDVKELIAPEIMEMEDEMNAVGIDNGKYAICERLIKLFSQIEELKL